MGNWFKNLVNWGTESNPKEKTSIPINTTNKNIRLSREQRERVRERNIRKNNLPKPPYNFTGKEKIRSDYKTYIEVLWNDGKKTKAEVRDEDYFNYELGLLICSAKKLVKKFNYNMLEYLSEGKVLKLYYMLTLLLNQSKSGRAILKQWFFGREVR